MIHLFSISLEGDALSWFLSLTKEQVQDLNIIIELFIKRFAHLMEIKPTWAELTAERKKSGETVLRYIVRWRNMLAKSELPIPEKHAVELLVNNLEGPIQMALIYSPVSTFDELIERVTHLQQNEDKLAPITEDVLAINQNNQQGCNSRRRRRSNNSQGQYTQQQYQYPTQQQEVTLIQQQQPHNNCSNNNNQCWIKSSLSGKKGCISPSTSSIHFHLRHYERD